MKKQNTLEIAIVNQQSILVLDTGERMVPINPICQALGIDEYTQKRKIEADEILNSTTSLRLAVAKDGKEREMFSIPLKYVFGWLFTINPKNVKVEARESVIAYRKECYDVLYRYFTDHAEFYKQKQAAILHQTEKIREVNRNFHAAKSDKKKAEEEMHNLASQSYEDWKDNNRQLNLFGNNEPKES